MRRFIGSGLALALSACGESGPAFDNKTQSCATFAVGVWKGAGVYYTAKGKLDVEGTWELKADGTYTGKAVYSAEGGGAAQEWAPSGKWESTPAPPADICYLYTDWPSGDGVNSNTMTFPATVLGPDKVKFAGVTATRQ